MNINTMLKKQELEANHRNKMSDIKKIAFIAVAGVVAQTLLVMHIRDEIKNQTK